MKVRGVRRPFFSAVAVGAIALGACVSAWAFEIDYDSRRATELRPCDEHRYRGRQEQARACYDALANAAGALTRAEAAWQSRDVRRANELFRGIVQANPETVRERVRWGYLYLQTHQYADAAALFREALERAPNDPQAMLGLAQVMAERFDGGARELIEQALTHDSNLPLAHLLLARMDLEEGKLDEAQGALARAARAIARMKAPPLELNALRAVLEQARGRDPERWLRELREYNPRYGAAYEQLAHFEVMRRRYREANEWLRRAIEAEPQRWSAHAELGLNLLRLGDLETARKHLTTAYSGDPYSATIVNSLRLLDRVDEFALVEDTFQVDGQSVRLQLRLHKNEAGVLAPYVTELARAAIETFSRRYRFSVREPITLELYPDHDDFAVRVAALPGIGLLGVTFGTLVAMDSPSGRPRGEFHWGSTLWHELAHVFTLEATEHRVPRWLSEGISVFEEWRTGPTPGVTVPPEVLQAIHAQRLLPVADLDAGFIRPSYPGQIQVSYVQAGLICLFIEQRWGFDRLATLLHAFKQDVTTVQALQSALDVSPADFDSEFNAFVRERYAAALREFERWQSRAEAARAAFQKEQWQAAIDAARDAIALYPEYVAPDSPSLLLAHALERSGQRAEAIAALQAYRTAGGWEPGALRDLARWLHEAGRNDESLEVLSAVNYADPHTSDLHVELGERLLAGGRGEAALREFRVLLSMPNADPAIAHFGAARALRALGRAEEGRRHLLDALAAAPHYRPAQALLLETIEERVTHD
jgi:tetratricopeptide (TPR) repeat protein